jgi:ATP-dependent DNA ligase
MTAFAASARLCYIEQSRCCFLSRNGNVLSRFEVLAEQLAALLQIDEAIIDGEVIAVRRDRTAAVL